MRMPWTKPKTTQLDLLDEIAAEPTVHQGNDDLKSVEHAQTLAPTTSPKAPPPRTPTGQPLIVRVTCLYEDVNNPRTDFPEPELDQLTDDVRQHGILQAIVVHPADADGCYRIHFGAKRLRAAIRAGLHEVPVVVRDAPADPYTQVAENQKRHGLTPLDLARFIRGRADAGDSNATIAKRLVMDQTSVAHHLALLELPPELDDALKTGRCTSPRTLYELSKLRDSHPEQVHALVASDVDITRAAVAGVRHRPERTKANASITDPTTKPTTKPTGSWLAEANDLCARLEHTLGHLNNAEHPPVDEDLQTLRRRVADLVNRLA